MVQLTISSLGLAVGFLAAIINAQGYPQDRFSLEIIPRVTPTDPPTLANYNSSSPIYLGSNGGVTNSSKEYVCSLWPSVPYELGSELHCANENNALGIQSNVASQALHACIPQYASDKPVGCFSRGFKFNYITRLMEWPSFGSRFWLVETRDGAGELIGGQSLWATVKSGEESAPVAGAVPVSLRVYSIYKMPTGPHRATRY